MKKIQVKGVDRFHRLVCASMIVVFIASPASAAVNWMHMMTPVCTTPFDMKLLQSGFFEIQSASTLLPLPLSVDQIFSEARSFRYTPDTHGDRWQSPAETELKHSGDCEDKAIWLYAELRKNGFSQVRLVIGRLRSFDNKCHVWVEIGDPNDALILDAAAQKRVWKRSDFLSGSYKPLFAMEGERRFVFKSGS